MKNYPSNKIVYNHNNEIWSIDLTDMIDYKISNNKGFRYIIIIIDIFSKSTWAIPLKNVNSKSITEEFSNFPTNSKRSPLKIESDRGSEFYNSIFQNIRKCRSIHHFSRFTDKSPSIAKQVIRTIRKLLKKLVFEKGNAGWLSEIPSFTEQYDNTIHISIKMSPIQAGEEANEKIVFNNLKDDREKQTPSFYLGKLVPTADIKRIILKEQVRQHKLVI